MSPADSADLRREADKMSPADSADLRREADEMSPADNADLRREADKKSPADSVEGLTKRLPLIAWISVNKSSEISEISGRI